ncbi:unnamed protein product [Rotaria sordida]|uniref:ABC transporter domain-containing protein n=2 Tax=Rotaria sordida TaxID=392033 RepID=A0A818WMR8_9BILA|nr:unnamed protein product [Rotaria sordida]CAF4046619.1 unnamed protein product [Rotaria sordida]
MNETQLSEDSVACEEAINMNGDIQFVNIDFAYPARPDVLVLRNLTLTARAGEITAIVGLSGSGSSGAICNRLSSDALAIQQMAGIRLGIVCESMAMFGIGLLLGLLVSWQLTLIALFYIVSIFVLAFMQIRWQARLNKRSECILELASSCFDGVDIRQLNIQWLRSCLGLVSQEPILFDLTIAENIAYGKENISIEDIIDAATKANIHHFIQQLPQGYETKVGMRGSHLSGGEKQRIAIARALLRRPKVLLLDEATSAMDSFNEQMVQEALERTQTDNSARTSLVVTHSLSTIRSRNLICVLDKGHLVESGTHADLMNHHGAYYHMIVRSNTS